MINLKIDPEFQNQIPPLTDDEYKQLEENILKEGKLLSPLIVWNNTLVDGHNRYAILQKHPEICFSTMPLRFESREEVLAWICKNQLGRRNLTPEQKLFQKSSPAAGGYEESARVARNGKEACIKYGHYQVLHSCLEIEAECDFFLGKKEESAERYREAFYICKVMRYEDDLQIIRNEAQKYLDIIF